MMFCLGSNCPSNYTCTLNSLTDRFKHPTEHRKASSAWPLFLISDDIEVIEKVPDESDFEALELKHKNIVVLYPHKNSVVLYLTRLQSKT